MLPLLVQLHSVLTSDSLLTSLVPPDKIGASIRQDAGPTILEYGIAGEDADHSGHRTITLRIDVYSAAGAEDVHQAQEAVERLMTAKKLTPAKGSFKVVQCRLTESRSLPRNEWAYTLRREYTTKVADLRPRTQKQ